VQQAARVEGRNLQGLAQRQGVHVALRLLRAQEPQSGDGPWAQLLGRHLCMQPSNTTGTRMRGGQERGISQQRRQLRTLLAALLTKVGL
jgi:hypothetical protein